ncbi:hypothetical protein A1Q2_02686 [Trichosporon asahii var. asahii CBS 8904]|uniref:Uncharacterized protein n=1 Tax=Trichosporon asahii var. asahii (strain CBS 8904) TaxID=1220162 RepID=K1VQZ1_TRIAC|nr:hypothetical protein A1Q2_02686 [Trichosporon asahii var. asahii CBS 8904]
MSRSKPYSRQSSGSGPSGGKRDTDAAWKHDLHDSRPALLQRLGSGSPASSASSLKSRLGLDSSSPRERNSPSYAGRELLPGNSGQVHGLRSDSIGNAGKELLPAGKSARSGRGSRPRGSNGNEGAAFAANALGNLRRDRNDRSDRDRRDKPVSIAGAARAWVRVEHLAPGTTGADVKSAFASSPIQRAEVTSRPGDKDVVVELELPDEEAARELPLARAAAEGSVLATGRRTERGERQNVLGPDPDAAAASATEDEPRGPHWAPLARCEFNGSGSNLTVQTI